MERLTEYQETEGGIPFVVSKNNNGDPVQEAFQRLAAYEDTGYEPGQFETAMDAIKAHLWDVEQELKAYKDTGLTPEEIVHADKMLKDNWEMPLKRLTEAIDLINAKDDGRLVVLPCKVGDILHEVDLPEYGVITCKAVSISYYNGPMFHVPGNEAVKSLTVEVEVIDGHGKGSSYNFEIEDFGKHVFLTRQEAEETMRKEEEHG